MTETFELTGDPDAILGSASHWTSFGSSAHCAAGDVSAMDASQFCGDEGDTYRGRIKKDMTPHLIKAGEAWSDVGKALRTYAHTLRSLQEQMATLKKHASEQKGKVDSSQHAVQQAHQADLAKTQAAKPDPHYTSGTADAKTGHSQAVEAYNGSVAQAAKIRHQHHEAVKKCCSSIDDAKHKRFQKPPGFWGSVGAGFSDLVNVVKKGLAYAVKHVAPVLDLVSMVSGVLALVPFLAPIMGPISLISGGLSLGIKVLDKALNGSDTSWFELGVSAVALIPGVKPLTTLGKARKLTEAASLTGKAGRELGQARKALAVAKNAGKGVRSAKKAVAEAGRGNAAARAAEAKLASKYAKIDKAWKWGERGLVVTGSGLNAKVAYDKSHGSWTAAAVAGATSAVGYKINPANRRLTAVQNIVTNGAATGNQAVQMTINRKWGDPKEWAKLGTAAGKTVVHSGNAVAYSSAGYHPNSTARASYEVPNYWR